MREALEHELDKVLNTSLEMLGIVEKMLPVASQVLVDAQTDKLQEVKELDQRVDELEHEIEAECLKIIALHQPVARDLRMVGVILKSLADIERMGDYVVHVAQAGAELAQAPALKKYVNLQRMLEHLVHMSQELRAALQSQDVTAAENIITLDDEIDGLYDQTQRELITYILEDPRNISKSLLLMRVCRSVERIGDHMENIAERVRYWVTGERFFDYKNKEDEQKNLASS